MTKKTNWTPEQLEAITQQNCSLLVAAAAGAGKTAVLVERIIRKITDPRQPVDIDKLLIVTFTNAAAAEMRERIARAISAALEKNPHSRNLQKQLTLLNKASITTLHSFFLEVIRNNFQLIDIDPGFRIADETEAALLQLDVLNELFEEQYEKEGTNPEFFELLECYGGNRDDRVLQNMVLELYSFIQSIPWPQEWLEEMTERFNLQTSEDFAETSWGKVLLQSVCLELEGLQELLKRAIALVNGEPGLEGYLDTFLEDLKGLEALTKIAAATAIWDTVYSAFREFSFNRLSRAGKEANAIKKDQAKKLRDNAKDGIKKLQDRVFFAASAETIEDLQVVYPMMKALARLTFEFAYRYGAKKKQKSIVDFNDLEHFCLEILSERDEEGKIKPSKTALAYRERYAEILVDEYQDSNLVQEMMIKMISREDTGNPNVFMVGDVKQSIYRFRQARPELFLEKYRSYSLKKDAPFRKILLFKNFRSRKEIVGAVNFIFKQIMSIHVGELDYTDSEALNPGAYYPEYDCEKFAGEWGTELHLIQTGDNPDTVTGEDIVFDAHGMEGQLPVEGEMPDNIQCEARLVARRIQELMRPDEQGRRFCIYDKDRKQYRELQYRDIVILLRATRNWAEVFMEELGLEGIPAFADTGTGFFKTTEVQVMLSLLQVIDNPLQDIPLLAVLRSPIFSFTTDELAEVRLADRKADIYHALCQLAEDAEKKAGEAVVTSEDGEGLPNCQASRKAAAFLGKLRKWREMSLYMSTDQLLWQLYNETGYYAMVGAMPAGEQRQANLRILFERARQFEGTSYKGLFNFIYFIEKLKSSRGDMGSARLLGENDNVVRIMSIHKSKGLEFPVVFLSGCGKQFNLQDSRKGILLHQDLGFGPDVVHYKRRLRYPSVAKQAICEKIVTESLSEEMRILYVAMTRAREKLIITGAVDDIGKALEKWSRCAQVRGEKLSPYDVYRGRSFLDWIGPAVLRNAGSEVLRDTVGMYDCEALLLEDPSRWNTCLWNKAQVLGPGALEEVAVGTEAAAESAWLPEELVIDLGCPSEGTSKDTDSDTFNEINRRLSWKYPFAYAARVPAMISVTELKRRLEEERRGKEDTLETDINWFTGSFPGLVKKPLFLEEKKGLSPAEVGTAMHFVMQHLDFAKGNYEEQIEAMTARELLTEQQADSINVDQIKQFFASPLGKRLISSDSVSREVPFQIELPCRELYSAIEQEDCQDETLLLQGIIDCYFEEEDGIVLLDYKTDYVPEGGIELIRDRYRVQIDYYARALELLTGKRVKGKYIYLFSIGEVLEF